MVKIIDDGLLDMGSVNIDDGPELHVFDYPAVRIAVDFAIGLPNAVMYSLILAGKILALPVTIPYAIYKRRKFSNDFNGGWEV